DQVLREIGVGTLVVAIDNDDFSGVHRLLRRAPRASESNRGAARHSRKIPDWTFPGVASAGRLTLRLHDLLRTRDRGTKTATTDRPWCGAPSGACRSASSRPGSGPAR